MTSRNSELGGAGLKKFGVQIRCNIPSRIVCEKLLRLQSYAENLGIAVGISVKLNEFRRIKIVGQFFKYLSFFP